MSAPLLAQVTLYDLLIELREIREDMSSFLDELIVESRKTREAVERIAQPAYADTPDPSRWRVTQPPFGSDEAIVSSALSARDGPLWQCGHHHPTRGEAIRCEAEQKAASERAWQEQNKFSPQEVHAAHNKPPNADAGSFD